MDRKRTGKLNPASVSLKRLNMIQTLTLEFEEGTVRVFVQILELEKQTYVYVGMGSLDSMSVAVPGIGQEEVCFLSMGAFLLCRLMMFD